MRVRQLAYGAIALAGALAVSSLLCRGDSVSSKQIQQIEGAKVVNAAQLDSAAAHRDSTSKAVKHTKAKRDAAASEYAVVRSSIDLDSLPLPAVRVIQSADKQLHADSLHIDALNADRVALAGERDLWKERSDLNEDALVLERKKKAPRFGFRAGVLTTLGAVAALLLLVK